MQGLTEQTFVGTESRLLTLFELLRQMDQGTQTDPAARLKELQRRRDEIDREMAEIRAGRLLLLDDTALRERFVQFQKLARELLADFREVEQNFRKLDRSVRERIARGDEGKGALLDKILGERDVIADSDQGRSFRAFWDFLMSQARQEEFKSGGQKEKLAYTVLAASLAYQFGLEWGNVHSRSFRFVVIDEAFGRGSDESARYALKLFEQLGLQLLIVTPLQKIHIIEPFVAHVGYVQNPDGRSSTLLNLTIEEYRERQQAMRQELQGLRSDEHLQDEHGPDETAHDGQEAGEARVREGSARTGAEG